MCDVGEQKERSGQTSYVRSVGSRERVPACLAHLCARQLAVISLARSLITGPGILKLRDSQRIGHQ